MYSQISLLALWLVLGQRRWRLLVAPISLFFLDIDWADPIRFEL